MFYIIKNKFVFIPLNLIFQLQYSQNNVLERLSKIFPLFIIFHSFKTIIKYFSLKNINNKNEIHNQLSLIFKLYLNEIKFYKIR